MDDNPLSRLWEIPQRFLRNPLLQRVIRNSAYLSSADTFAASMSFAQGVLAARLLGVEGLGVLGAITQFSTVLNRLTSFNMSGLVVTYVGRFSGRDQPERAAAVFKAATVVEVVSSLLAFGLILLLSPLAARIVGHDPALSGLFALYGVSVLANFMAESGTGLLQHFDRFRTIAIITATQSMVTLVLIAGAFFMQGSLVHVVVAYMVGKVLWATALSGVALVEAQRAWGPGWWRTDLRRLAGTGRELVGYSVSTNLSSSIQLLSRDSELLWISGFSTPTQVGYYKIAKAIVGIVTIPITPLIRTTYREVAHEVANRAWENVRYLLRSGFLLSSLWTLPAVVALVVFGRFVVAIYGIEFLPTSYHTLLVLLIGMGTANLFYWNRTPLMVLGLPEYPAKVQFVAAVLKVGATFFVVPRWGAVGMAALLSAYLVQTILVLVWRSLRELNRVEAEAAFSPG